MSDIVKVHLIASGHTKEVILGHDAISADVIKKDGKYYAYNNYRGNILIFKAAKVLDLDAKLS